MRKPIPRSPRTLAKSEAANKKTKGERVLQWGPFIISAASLATSLVALTLSLLLNSANIMAKVDRLYKWVKTDQEVSGYWTTDTEGIIDGPPPGLFNVEPSVDMQLRVFGGSVFGEIRSDSFCHYDPSKVIYVAGQIHGNTADLVIWDFVSGKKLGFAALKADINRASLIMDVTVDTSLPKLLPIKFSLWRREATPSEVFVDPPSGKAAQSLCSLAEMGIKH